MRLSRLAATLAILLAPAVSLADDTSRRLASYENEARQLATDVNLPDTSTGAAGQRRLVDAEVAYALGDYDTSALILFDLAGKQQGADNEAATYYLGESLLKKGDRGAARGYFKQVVDMGNTGGKFYGTSVERLLDIAITDGDQTSATDALSALDRGPRMPSVPYAKGKYLFSQGKYDDAISAFNEVPKGSDFELQALYYMGATQVAKKELEKATDTYTDLINRKPRSWTDRRVIELGQLALGRLFYEREQPSKSIDSYLLVDRHSDLFPDALYEVAWVYVKSKQYDKALRALELLEQSDPTSTKTPTVRILEGNLRIRKAQMIRTAQVEGTINPNEKSDPETEYAKATKIFGDTHDMYAPSYEALRRVGQGNQNPEAFVEQIAERSQHVFQSAAPMPEAAAQMLRDQPDVQRFVSVERDISDVESNIRETEATITRLEAVLAAPDHSMLYPRLASRRSRIGAIQEELNTLRGQIADQELALVSAGGELAGLTATRKQIADAYGANPEQAYADRVSTAQADYDKLDDAASEVDSTIDSTQAIAVALRMYTTTGNVPEDQKASALKDLDDAAREAQSIEDELAAVHREVVLGKDLAGIGDETIVKARDDRKKLKAALDAEHRALAGMASSSRNPSKSQELVTLGDRAARIADQLEQTDSQIAGTVEQGISKAHVQLLDARRELGSYQQELVGYEAESRTLGGQVLAGSFKDVRDKLEDVVIRTDVGTVDVAWSRKEDSDDDYKRLGLARARELKQLRDEFRDILDQGTQRPQAQKPAPQPATTEGSNPEKGTGPETRIKPVEDTPKGPQQPAVRPDAKGGNK
jgi:tetratricopeptide (TPR) repeat protein